MLAIKINGHSYGHPNGHFEKKRKLILIILSPILYNIGDKQI